VGHRVDYADGVINRNHRNQSDLQCLQAKLRVEHNEGEMAVDLNDSSPGKARTSPLVHSKKHCPHHPHARWIRFDPSGQAWCDKLVSPPRRKRFEIQPLSVEQVQQLLAVTRDHRLEALFILALATGMRRGELLGLKWQDINFQTDMLQVRRILTRVPTKVKKPQGATYVEAEPKTEKGRRSILLPQFVLEALKQHCVRQLEAKLKAGAEWQEHDYVFCTSVGTHLHPTRDVLAQLKVLLVKAGLPDIRFHDLRHSSATMLLSMGVHPQIVQEILGHSQISMTMDTYSHVLPTMQKEAMSKLNELLQG
jgi:integrase